MGSVLVVDSDTESASRLAGILVDGGLHTRSVGALSEALRALDDEPFDAVVLDTASGVDPRWLAETLTRFDDLPVVVTSSGDTRCAVDAIRAGAADVIEKPLDSTQVLYVVRKVLSARIDEATVPPPPSRHVTGLLGSSRAMQQVLDVLRRVAPGVATVLVRGESGTGKELVARALHAQSARASGPFVKVHCAALPDTLLESELFGYEKGAFTGAISRKPGRVEIADKGTLFLDEIGDITPALQVKLLRLLQDREYERLGGNTTLTADVRFVAATHRDLESMIKEGAFREDLFYRLNVVPIWLPPLRARREDTETLARHFCRYYGEVHDKRGIELSPGAIVSLKTERWPGNVRQLQNFIERLVVLSETSVIDEEVVRKELAPPELFATQNLPGGPNSAPGSGSPPSSVVPLDAALREAEKRAIERALRHAKGNRTLAARLLGVSRATLYTKLEEHGLNRRASTA